MVIITFVLTLKEDMHKQNSPSIKIMLLPMLLKYYFNAGMLYQVIYIKDNRFQIFKFEISKKIIKIKKNMYADSSVYEKK